MRDQAPTQQIQRALARLVVMADDVKFLTRRDVVRRGPCRLPPMRAKRITDTCPEQKAVREIMVFLHEHGVGTARATYLAVRIYKTYGADAVPGLRGEGVRHDRSDARTLARGGGHWPQAMTENPYRLACDIRGIGFKTADAIAIKLGIEKSAMIRVRAGISFALAEAMDEGHCGLPTEELLRRPRG
jgi:exodeoxyribonuclease V alpha subunit